MSLQHHASFPFWNTVWTHSPLLSLTHTHTHTHTHTLSHNTPLLSHTHTHTHTHTPTSSNSFKPFTLFSLCLFHTHSHNNTHTHTPHIHSCESYSHSYTVASHLNCDVSFREDADVLVVCVCRVPGASV